MGSINNTDLLVGELRLLSKIITIVVLVDNHNID
jgi:hypothetical protein